MPLRGYDIHSINYDEDFEQIISLMIPLASRYLVDPWALFPLIVNPGVVSEGLGPFPFVQARRLMRLCQLPVQPSCERCSS